MKLNHFICPNCGHDFYAEGACVSCDACNCIFYASQSRIINRFMRSQTNAPVYQYPKTTAGENYLYG